MIDKQQTLYIDCVNFWMRMGIKKEDNLIALSSLDVLNAFKEATLECYKTPYYINKARALVEELSKPKYDNNRGRNGWLNNSSNFV